MIALNRSHYLRDYRSSRLPKFHTLVLLLVIPLLIVDHRQTSFGSRMAWLLLLAVGCLASFVDWELHLLPNRLLLPCMSASLIAIAWSGNLWSASIGSISWFSGFALLALVNPAGLGWGDVKFAALLGLDCGAIDLDLVPVAIFVGLVGGGSYALGLIVRGHRRTQIPFGPFMFIGALVALIGG